MKYTRSVFVRSVLLAGMLASIWWLLSCSFPGSGFPSPVATLAAWTDLFAKDLGKHLLYTFLRLSIGIIPALICGSMIGVFMHHFPSLDAWFRPLLLFLSTIPKTALFPLVVLFLGLNDTARVLTVGLVVFFQAWISIRDEMGVLDQSYRSTMEAYGAKAIHCLRYIYLPGILPRFFTVLRIGTAGAWAVLFFTETSLYQGYGLGRLVVSSWMTLDYPSMAAVVLTGAVSGWGLYCLYECLEYYLVPWKRR